MAVYDQAIAQFVTKFGADAVEAALTNYENQRARSAQAAKKAQAQRQGLANLLAKAKNDPKIAEILKAAGVSLGS